MEFTSLSEALIIQNSVMAFLEAAVGAPVDCRLIVLLVIPLFMACINAFSTHARHFVLLVLKDIETKARLLVASPGAAA
jgi:hypothetical protein